MSAQSISAVISKSKSPFNTFEICTDKVAAASSSLEMGANLTKATLNLLNMKQQLLFLL